MTKTILTCAITGNITTREQNPNLPTTPDEIAQSAVHAAQAGAAIVHLHVRDLQTGRGTMDLSLYRQVVELIGKSGSDVIINLTTGEGQRFVPSVDEPSVAAEGTTLCRPELRTRHVEDLRPEVCTLDFNTMNNGPNVVINTPANLTIMAERIYAAGTKPEIEIFDSGDLNMLLDFLAQGKIKEQPMVQLVMGAKYGLAADSATMMYMVSRLPKGAQWAAFGIGRNAFKMVAQSFLLGGHVRIGMEDTIYIDKGELAHSNAQLVTKARGIVESLGGTLASPDEARHILGLEGRGMPN